MSTPKRHHYLPQVYLQGFCRDGMLWLYDRECKNYRRQQPINTAVIKHYYSYIDEDGTQNPEIELTLAKYVDNNINSVIAKIDNGLQLEKNDKNLLALFVSFLHFRVPQYTDSVNALLNDFILKLFHHNFSDINILKPLVEKEEIKTGVQNKLTPEQMVEFYNKYGDQIRVDINRTKSLEYMMKSGPLIAEYLCHMNWVFLHAPIKASFITNDTPFFITPPDNFENNGFYSGYGIATKGTKKIVPISKNVCIIIHDLGGIDTHININNVMVRTLNRLIARHSYRFIFGRDKALVEKIVNVTKLDGQEPSLRFKLG